MQIIKKWSVLIAVVGLVTVLSACQATRRALDFDTAAKLTITAAADVNPDSGDRPSPIVITVYALADNRQFEREDFLSLYENAAARLGSDLVRTIRLRELAPGESRNEIIELDSNVRYIGLLAEYSRYDQAQALLILPIATNKTNSYAVVAERLRLTTNPPR